MCFPLGYDYFPGQYIGTLSNYYNSAGDSRVISSISCPNGAIYDWECNITFSDTGCSSYGNDSVISCIDSKCCNNTVYFETKNIVEYALCVTKILIVDN